MHDGEVQSILRCKLCNKPFDKESTLKRHGYYCRSRKVGSTTRSRSCVSCTKSKARCDNKRPACSRCMTKGVECHYGSNTLKDVPNRRRKLSTSVLSDSSRTENQKDASNYSDAVLDDGCAIPDVGFENVGGNFFDWFDPNIDFSGLLNLPTFDKSDQYPIPDWTSSGGHRISLTNPTVEAQLGIPSPNLPTLALQPHNPRSLIHRPKLKTSAQRTSNLIFHTLKSYPLMMLRHSMLPPFMHPGLLFSETQNRDMEPLTNCMNLMHMNGSGIQGSRKLFWRNVRLECEHLCHEYQNLNQWELLAAMQALSIYILQRLVEGETEQNNFDTLLTYTVTIVAKRLNVIHDEIPYDTHSASDNDNLQTRWKAWIFEESIRRLCIIYQIVNMLIYFEPAAMCDLPSHLILAPLPARKQLWEASDEYMWQAENESNLAARPEFGLAATGDLVKLEDGQQSVGDSDDAVQMHKYALNLPAAWEEWCSGMDELGSLVMLAASLIV